MTDSAAGRKNPKKGATRGLSSRAPTREETDAITEALFESVPLATAIYGQALVETALATLIRRKLKHRDDDTWARLTGENGPLNSFGSMVSMGAAMGLYSDALRQNMNTIKLIRNAFAHSKRIIDFEEPEIIADLRHAKLPEKRYSEHYKLVRRVKAVKPGRGQEAYINLCSAVYIELVRRQTRSSIASSRNYKRAVNKLARDPLFGAMRPHALQGVQVNALLWPPGSVSGGPTALAQVPLPLRPRGLLATNDDTEDK